VKVGIKGYRVGGFYGQYHITLDEKGRLSLPSKLRNVLGANGKPLLSGAPVLCSGLDGCLCLYPEGEWQSMQERLSTLSFTRKDFRYFSRRLYETAATVSPDRSGRILIPAHLIKSAGLDKDLLVTGVNRWIEIWNPQRHADYLEQFGFQAFIFNGKELETFNEGYVKQVFDILFRKKTRV